MRLNQTVHAVGCAHDSWEKRNVLIVSISLLIVVGFTLRSNTHRAVKVLGMREGPGNREEPGTLTQGAPTTSPSGDLIPTIRGSAAHPGGAGCAGLVVRGELLQYLRAARRARAGNILFRNFGDEI